MMDSIGFVHDGYRLGLVGCNEMELGLGQGQRSMMGSSDFVGDCVVVGYVMLRYHSLDSWGRIVGLLRLGIWRLPGVGEQPMIRPM